MTSMASEEERKQTPEEALAEQVTQMQDAVSQRADQTEFTDFDPKADAEFAAKLNRLRSRHPDAQLDAEASKGGESGMKGLGAGMASALAIICVPMVGVGLGWLADRGTDSNVFTLIGFIVGGAAAVFYVIYIGKKMG